MENKKDWKDSLNMGQTNFDMKANLVNKEADFQKMWLDKDIYQKALKQNTGNKSFVLHDGPPYANGSLHVGHALNKILKDIIVRYKTMNGFYSPFIPGWDTHGLPIENKMLEELKMSKDDMNKITLRKEAKKYALKQVANQQSQFSAMSLFSDFKDKYVTLNQSFEVGQLKLFKKMVLDGLIYKGLKPVYWSPSSMSALAEAEVEYEDIRSPQIIVAFEITKGNDVVAKGDKLTIMTTTPWTLVANSGVAVGAKILYNIILVDGIKYVVAAELTSEVAELAKWESFEILSTANGSDFVGVEYARPIREETAPVIIGHHVTTDAGTGLVHIAPLFGEDDYLIGKEHNLDMIMHVADNGTFNAEGGKYEGMFYEAANKDIGMYLDSKGVMLSIKFVKHSYPHDWRTHKPVIFRGTPQWFVSIDKIKKDILAELKKVKSYPEWGVSRISKMIDGRSDWTISRQRTWGVPIIIFYDADENIVATEATFNHVIDLIAEHGTDVWWEKSTDELLPEELRGKGYTREMDIMDVWFDSGSSHVYMENLLKEKYNLDTKGQFDLYLEGSDQYRGWFNSSLINSVAYRKASPYKNLVSHGFVLDGKNQKMSKSKGNVVDPFKIISKSGTDILRLWVANAEYTSDVTISDEIIKQTSQLYRNFRTKLRFMLGNLFDFKQVDKVKLDGFHALIEERLNNLKVTYKKYMDEYKFSAAVKEINKFLLETSGFYLDYSKDEMYVGKADSSERRMFQTNMYDISEFLILALAPFIPTTMEEAYTNFPKDNKKESVHLELMDYDALKVSETHEAQYTQFFNFKDEVYKALEDARKEGIIKRANEAHISVETNLDFVKGIKDLKTVLMVGKLDFVPAADATKQPYFKVNVSTFDSEKCQRCWNHYDKGSLTDESICTRCNDIVNSK